MNRNSIVYLFLVVFTLLGSVDLSATHNRAGEITYSQLGPLTIRATITTYTKGSSQGADRDSLLLMWGDGTSDDVLRSNGLGEPIPGEDIQINYYIMDHTYPSRGTYVLSFQDPNRVSNIQNVNFPNSVDVPFYVETRFTLIESQFQGPNNSVILLQPPIDFACIGERFIHNPNAYDPDGDSISYSLVTPLEGPDMEVPKYILPDEMPGTFSSMDINSRTGDLIWDVPQIAGEFNIAIRINEYRNGLLLNSVIRDMQILVIPCNDNPPVLTVANEICVVAGERISLPVTVTDIDTGQMVRLSATGGPFQQEISPAVLSDQNIYRPSPLQAQFVWDTKCEHISDTDYQVVFRGQDDSRMGVNGNSVLKSLRIRIVGPPPENIDAEVVNDDQVRVTWDKPYACEQTINDFFIGFRVYRKEGTDPFVPGDCENGLEGKGYEVVEFQTKQADNNRYFFVDTSTEKGKIYCYRVVGTFAQRTSSGQLFGVIESITSEEICVQIDQDIPILTEVSVLETNVTTGRIAISWLKPDAMVLDTIFNPGPYAYKLLRSSDNAIYQEIYDITTEDFGKDVILSFEDNGLDTENEQYYYKVEFYSQDAPYSVSLPASSVRTEVISTDRRNFVSCREQVPWVNYKYSLEREVISGGVSSFEVIDSSELCDFEDRGLMNDTSYCYRVKSLGTFGLEPRTDSLVNYSQIICGTPIDTIGPCAPTIFVDNPCAELAEGVDSGELSDRFFNLISWESVSDICEYSDDVVAYNIYFSPDSIMDHVLIGTVSEDDILEYEHLPEGGIDGCYAVSGIDRLGNEGPLGSFFCVDNCPIYVLPNAFTPNGDGSNDIYRPRENLFVAEVEFKLFNRWGNLIYETSDPDLNWNGNTNSGKEIMPGTYYYTCRVLERGNSELVESDFLHGYIQLIR